VPSRDFSSSWPAARETFLRPETKARGHCDELKDIGPFLRERIEAYFKIEGIPVVLRCFDPGLSGPQPPANCEDVLLCDLFARHAVHAAMAGKTGLVIGFLHERFIHVPIELLATHPKRLDPAIGWWSSVRRDRATEAIHIASPCTRSEYHHE
jgi:hypothetical protein